MAASRETRSLFYRWVSFVSRAGAGLCSAIIVLMVVSTMIDTMRRYLFNDPIPGVIESNEVIFPVFVFIGLAYTQLEQGHIRVTLLLDRLGRRSRQVVEILTLLLCLALACGFAYQTGIAAQRSYNMHEEYWAVIKGMRLYVWPAKMAVTIGFWMLVLQYVADIVETIRNPAHGQDKEAANV